MSSGGAALMSINLGLKKTAKTIDALYKDLEVATGESEINQLKEDLKKAQDKEAQLLQRKKEIEGQSSSSSASSNPAVGKHTYRPSGAAAAPAPAPKPLPKVVAPAPAPRPVAPAPAPRPAPAPKPAPAPAPKPATVRTPTNSAPVSPKKSATTTPATATASSSGSGETAEELQARIAELQRQIAAAKTGSPSPAAKPKPKLSAPTPETTTTATAPKSPYRNTTQNYPSVPPPPVNAADVSATQTKADWNRPGWASAMEQHDERAVNTDSIGNELKQKQQAPGYQRKVKAQSLDIQKGTFRKKAADPNSKPNARLCWVVGRIGDRGVPGKIVMHLYGQAVDQLVDDFEPQLKNKDLLLGGPLDAATPLTVDAEPQLHIFVGSAIPQGLDQEPQVFGVVQEGHEIVQKLADAGAAGSELTIKQAHIFPVKKSKSAF